MNWNVPRPGNLVIVPAGSQAVQIPLAYPCGGDAVDSTGTVNGASAVTSAASLAAYPTVKTNFNAPSLTGSGGFYSANAVQWAIPGANAWIAPMGWVAITGVSGELVSFTNISLPVGATVNAGSIIMATPPALPASGNALPANASSLSFLDGYENGNPRKLPAGSSGQVLKSFNDRWQASSGLMYVPLESEPDVTPAGINSITAATHSFTGSLSLPNLPSPLPPSFGVCLSIRLLQGSTTATEEIRVEGQLLASSRLAGQLAINTTIARVTSSTPQLILTKAASSTVTVTVTVNGYFV